MKSNAQNVAGGDGDPPILPPSDASLLSLIADQLRQPSAAQRDIVAQASQRLSTGLARSVQSAMEVIATGADATRLQDVASTRIARSILAVRED